jgi:hypothetical protein
MTPMAGGIANGKKNGLIVRLSSSKSFFTPGVPPDWIVFML